MNIPERGLGRGLSSLLSSASESGNEETRKLALTQLVPGKHQPRKIFENTALEELAVSIKNQGVIQPLLVRLSAMRSWPVNDAGAPHAWQD